jgi:hypothetical protein
MQLNRTSCCGVRDFHGLNAYTPERIPNAIYDMWPTWIQINGAYTFFTAPTSPAKLEAIQALVAEHNLGETFLMGPNPNPNSGNNLWMLVWKIERDAYTAWGTRIRDERAAQAQRVRDAAAAEDVARRIASARSRAMDGLIRRGSSIIVVDNNNAENSATIGSVGVVRDFGPRAEEYRVQVEFTGNDLRWLRRDAVMRLRPE